MRIVKLILLSLLGIIGLAIMPLSALAQTGSLDTDADADFSSDTLYEREEYYASNDTIYAFVSNDTIDRNAYKQRIIADSSWNRLTAATDYYYKKEPPQLAKERSAGSFENLLISLFQFFTSTAGKVLLWLVLGLLILVVCFYVFKQYGINFFRTKSTKINQLSADEADEEIPQDWELAIREAVSKQDFRTAVRLSYRHVVFLLQERGVLALSNANSNRQFLAALRTKPYWSQFSALLLHYEYLWYGHYPVDATTYTQIDKIYQSIKNQL